jgi:hypothetical protein
MPIVRDAFENNIMEIYKMGFLGVHELWSCVTTHIYAYLKM